MWLKRNCEGPSQATDMKLLTLVQLDEMCKWFAAVHSEANLETGL